MTSVKVVWSANGTKTVLATTFGSSTLLTATIPSSLLAAPVIAQVWVETGDPLSSLPLKDSNLVSFIVTSATGQSISSISPTRVAAGNPDLTLTIMGTKFHNTAHDISKVVWSANGTETVLATTFRSSTLLTATIPSGLLAAPVNAQVLVETGDPTSSLPLGKSNSVNFYVTSANPSISSISPTSVTAGSPDITLTVLGANFVSGNRYHSIVAWSGKGGYTTLPTTFVSSTKLSAVIPAALLTNSDTAMVWVQIWFFADSFPKAESNSLNFNVTSAAHFVSSILPSAATLGPKGVRQFQASLVSANAAVTWEVQEGAAGGSITSGGVYTAPDQLGTFHVVATSSADNSQSATATVSVVGSGFVPTGSMNKARSGHTASLLTDGKVLIVGGDDASAELFDPATGNFTFTGNMTTERYGATVTTLANGKVLIAGGFGPGVSSLPRLNTAELYDPSTGTFSATGRMVVPRVLHTATLLNDGKVLIAGGTDDNAGGGVAVADAELYDPKTGTFVATGGMHTDRAQHTATLLGSGEVLIVGGWNGHRADAADDPPWDPLFAELYEPASGSFNAAATMSTTRISHTAVQLANGKVLLLGGLPSLQNIHEQPSDPQYAELYDPVSNSLTGIRNLTESRRGYTATLLTHGNVLIAGGEDNGLAVGTAELLDPNSGILTATGSLATERKGHTATRLNDGRVLVTGGVDRGGNVLASAELFK
jgi:hypothetical protein